MVTGSRKLPMLCSAAPAASPAAATGETEIAAITVSIALRISTPTLNRAKW